MTRRSRNATRYLGTITRTQLDHAANKDTMHTHICRCGARYVCEHTLSLTGEGPCEGSMTDGDGCCPTHEAEWDRLEAAVQLRGWTVNCLICGRERPLEATWYAPSDTDAGFEHSWACLSDDEGRMCTPWIVHTGIGRSWLNHKAPRR